jgi:hypothetical protein
MRIIYISALLWALVFFTGCDLLDPCLDIILELPPLPEHSAAVFEIQAYKLVYPGVDGDLVTGYAAAEGGKIPIHLSKRYNSFVLAYPVITAWDIRLPPAGAVFPLQLERDGADTLVLTWEAGVAASVYERLWRQGIDISCFNTARLLEVMKEKAPADPWAIDINLIAERIAAHDFSVYDVKLLPARDVALDVPGGNWFLESPFALTLHNEPGSALGLTAVCYGFHRLFAADGSMRFDFCVSETDCVVISP